MSLKSSCFDIFRKHLEEGPARLTNLALFIHSSTASILCWIGKKICRPLRFPIKILFEIFYRFGLWLFIRYKIPQRLGVMSKPFWIFDKELGYHYSTTRVTGALLENGNVVACPYYDCNTLGNLGYDEGKTYDQSKLRILAFGDSFTAATGGVEGGPTWPDLLRKNLSAALRSDVSVLNFGRDGIGLLRMFDFAAAKVPEWKPDLFIIAFISGDLPRGRFWRTNKVVDGFERTLITVDPNPDPDPKKCADAPMFNSHATLEWAQQRLGKKLKPDHVVRHVFQQYLTIRRESHRHINLFDFHRSFVEQKISHNDPFYGLTPQYTNCPPFKGKSYAEDEKTVQNIRTLKETGIPMILVHFPTIETFELDSTDSYEQDPLYQSLIELSGAPIIKLKNFYSESIHGSPRKLFRLEVGDGHYSAFGLKFVSDELGKIILKILPSRKSFMERFRGK